jgi:hypothetical protein
VSDGTPQGTKLVTKFKYNFGPIKTASLGNHLVMVAMDSVSKRNEVFASDGTMSGTFMPKVPDDWSTAPLYPIEKFVQYHSALYYMGAYAVFSDYQLCRYSEFPMAVNLLKKLNLKIFPNPVKQTFQVMNINEKCEYNIMDITGKEIIKGQLNLSNSSIDVSNLPAGIYTFCAGNIPAQTIKFIKL